MEASTYLRDQLSFAQLPPEIRNRIYHLTLVSDGALEIGDLHPDEYQLQLNAGFRRRRTVYKIEAGLPTFWQERKSTTYALVGATGREVPIMAMLSLNRQTRTEALSIFYGLNAFSFRSTSSLTPFLLDRSPAAMKSLENFKIHLSLGDRFGLCNVFQIPGWDSWVLELSKLARFQALQLKQVVIHVDGQCRDLNSMSGVLDLESPTTKWIPTLYGNINNLNKLGIHYTCSICSSLQLADINARNQVEDELWNILAPKMLKRLGDEHDGAALQHRRIREFDPSDDDSSTAGEDCTSESDSKMDDEEDETTTSDSEQQSETENEEDDALKEGNCELEGSEECSRDSA